MGTTIMGSVLKRLTAPDMSECTFAACGFDTSDAPAQERLETAVMQFLVGYEFAIEQKGHDGLVARLESLERLYRGFAYEGAVMALTIRDVVSPTPGNKLTESFLAGPNYDSGPGSKHIFLAYIGIGFALARLPKALWRRALPEQSRIADNPALRWLIMDGFGFHMAYFDHHKWVDEQYVGQKYPWQGPIDYTNRAIDQGIGRGMWFVHGGNVDKLLAGINKFPPARRADLISGAGLAATYAGGVDVEVLEAFWKGAGEYRPELAQGAVFALTARVVADLVAPHNELAAQVFCNSTAEDAFWLGAADIADLPEDGAVPAYEVFRQRVQKHYR
jgi:hypothetical protein